MPYDSDIMIIWGNFHPSKVSETQQVYQVKIFRWKSDTSVVKVTGCGLKTGLVPCSNRNVAVRSNVQNECEAHSLVFNE